MNVALVGAGSAGLATLRLKVVCYEKIDQVDAHGSTEKKLDQDCLTIHTSMYKNFRTNLPKVVTRYPDYPIPETPESYLTRTQILDFLNSYCDPFNLRQCIRQTACTPSRVGLWRTAFQESPSVVAGENSLRGNTTVTAGKLGHNVQLVEVTNGERKWSIKVKDLQKNAVVNESFGAVMVCNGHYLEPSMPRLIGQNIFQAQQMHSHDCREPEIFADKKVCMVLPVDMLREEKNELEKREIERLQKMHFHMTGPKRSDYYDDLAGITPLPPVFANLYNESSAGFLNDSLHYRENRYRIIDDYSYIQL